MKKMKCEETHAKKKKKKEQTKIVNKKEKERKGNISITDQNIIVKYRQLKISRRNKNKLDVYK